MGSCAAIFSTSTGVASQSLLPLKDQFSYPRELAGSQYKPVEKDRQVDQGEVVLGRLAQAVGSLVTQTVAEVKTTKPLGVEALGELSHGLG